MEPSAVPALWYTILKSYGMLIVVIGVLAGFLYLIKKFSGLNYQAGSKNPIKVLGSHYLSPKNRLLIVDVNGEKMLLGATPSNINLISKLPDNDTFPALDEQKPDTGLFRKILSGSLSKKGTGDGDHAG